MKLGDVLKEARLKKGLSQTDVAQRLAITPAYYNRIENTKTKPPSWYLIEKLANLLDLDKNDLTKLADMAIIEYKQQRLNEERKSRGVKAYSEIRPIPILSEIPAGHPKDYDGFPPDIVEEYYQFKVEEQDPDAFLLRVEGDCMAPEIKKDDLLLIAPNEKVESGDIAAIVNGKGEKEVTRITIRKDEIILTPDNPAYPTIVWEAKDKPKIIGRVKEIIRRR